MIKEYRGICTLRFNFYPEPNHYLAWSKTNLLTLYSCWDLTNVTWLWLLRMPNQNFILLLMVRKALVKRWWQLQVVVLSVLCQKHPILGSVMPLVMFLLNNALQRKKLINAVPIFATTKVTFTLNDGRLLAFKLPTSLVTWWQGCLFCTGYSGQKVTS